MAPLPLRILFCFASIAVIVCHAHDHMKCGHDNFNHSYHRNIRTSLPRHHLLKQQQQQQQSARRLQEADNDNIPASNDVWDNIRISYNTDGLVEQWSDDVFKHWFATDVIPAAIEYLQKVIQVRPIDGNLTLEQRCNSWLDEDANQCSSRSSSYQTCGGYHDIDDVYFDDLYLCSGSSDCEYIPSGGGTAHDLLLYFVGRNSAYCNGVYGFSSFCHTNLYDRPIAGFVNICEQTLLGEGPYFTWEKAVTLVVHEVFHVLGFSAEGFALYRHNDEERTPRTPRVGGDDGMGNPSNPNFGSLDPTYRTSTNHLGYSPETIAYHYLEDREKQAQFIVLPTVVEVVRAFYNCSTMIGLELEDFGGADTASSHWEQRVLPMEFMIGYISSAAATSVFSFAVFEDSGWYKMNWDYAAVPPYGKGFGCDWYEEKCVQEVGEKLEALDPDLYCVEDVKYGCAADYVGKSNCEVKNYDDALETPFQYFAPFGSATEGGVLGYADFCPMFYHYSNGDCRIQESSHVYADFGAEICPDCKCTEMHAHDDSKQYAICYESECVSNYLYATDSESEGSYSFGDAEFYSDDSSYAAIRIKLNNDDYSKHEYVTCFAFESKAYKETAYYSYHVQCPEITDICYDRNPWICGGHGMRNPSSASVYDACFCEQGYVGCDCTVMNTQAHQFDAELIEATCSNMENEAAQDTAFGTIPDGVEAMDVGLLNITVQFDNRFAFEKIVRTLRLWIAINVRIHEDNVWLLSAEPLQHELHDTLPMFSSNIVRQSPIGGSYEQDQTVTNYTVSLAYYDDQNANHVDEATVVEQFYSLFARDVENVDNGNQFVLWALYKIQEPQGEGHRVQAWMASAVVLVCWMLSM